jgi:uncharacterized protein (DUF1778 family)
MATQATARIDLRLRADLKRLVEEAAELSAQTVASFVTSTVIDRAKSVSSPRTACVSAGPTRKRFLRRSIAPWIGAMHWVG